MRNIYKSFDNLGEIRDSLVACYVCENMLASERNISNHDFRPFIAMLMKDMGHVEIQHPDKIPLMVRKFNIITALIVQAYVPPDRRAEICKETIDYIMLYLRFLEERFINFSDGSLNFMRSNFNVIASENEQTVDMEVGPNEGKYFDEVIGRSIQILLGIGIKDFPEVTKRILEANK